MCITIDEMDHEPLPCILRIQTHSFCRERKNIYIYIYIYIYIFLVFHVSLFEIFEDVEMDFLLVGHIHEGIDAMQYSTFYLES